MQISKPLVILDLETTGTWVEKDRIIEIGMIGLAPSGDRKSYIRRVNPLIPIPPAVAQLTGITDADVKDAPVFKDLAREVVEFLGEADIGGFNVEKFDLPLLERELVEAGVQFGFAGRTVYDAQKIFHLNEKRDLTAAYAFYCGKPLAGAHSALADSEAALEVLIAQVDRYGEGNPVLEAMGRFNYRELTEFYDAERKFRWWNGELYMMFGKYAKRESLREVVKKDPGYLEWMLSRDFSDEVKELITGALRGRLPKYEESK